jgi:hypothetical protein
VEESGSYLHISISYPEKNLAVCDHLNMQHKQRMFFNEVKTQKSTMSNCETLNLCQHSMLDPKLMPTCHSKHFLKQY